MFYNYVRKLLFQFEAETAHQLTLNTLHYVPTFFFRRVPSVPRRVMGIDFPNPVGLAAGLDKNADHINALAKLGFGFIEIGTVTPKPQMGNPKPRIFRLIHNEALINRMGFNSKGLDYCIHQLKNTHYRGVLGINIGKNLTTPAECALDDYVIGLRGVYLYASYITVNISSPNTPGLRDLQYGEQFSELLIALKKEQQQLANVHNKYVPLVIKIAPDLNAEQIQSIATTLLEQQIDGVIATNTTVSREGLINEKYIDEAGGLSGKPLTQRNTQVVKTLHQVLQGRVPIIAVGGIMNAEDSAEKFSAGASLVQIYTGLIYQGPHLIKEIVLSNF